MNALAYPLQVLARFEPQILSIFRIMAALLVLQHGTGKILKFPTGPMNNVALTSLSGFAGIIELVFGVLLVIGLFSRLSAFVLSGLAAFAYFISHAPRDFFPNLNGGELAALYCFAFLVLAARGPGPWSVDALRGKS